MLQKMFFEGIQKHYAAKKKTYKNEQCAKPQKTNEKQNVKTGIDAFSSIKNDFRPFHSFTPFYIENKGKRSTPFNML